MRRSAAALLLAALLVGCGGAPDLDLAYAREVALTLTLREQVSFQGKTPSKSLRLSVRGAPEEDGTVVNAAVEWVELTYVDAEGMRVDLSTDGVTEDSTAPDALIRARRGLIEGLVDQPVRLRRAPGPADDDEGLWEIAGLNVALGVARAVLEAEETVPREVVDVAMWGLEPLLADGRTTRALRAAGLGPAPEVVEREGAEVRRAAPVHVDGYGFVTLDLFGRVGEGRGGAPTLRLEGRPRPDTEPAGDAGPEPPPGVGPVRISGIRATASTEYDPETLRPQRGHLTVELPHEGGPVVTRATEFLLVVRE